MNNAPPDGLFPAHTPIEGGWLGTADYSANGEHRYTLVRRWGVPEAPLLRWVMLNPSTATETVLDPTLRRCKAFATAWGYHGMIIQNIFALRSTDPKGLYTHPDPVGADNDAWLLEPGHDIAVTVAGWGVHSALNNRGAQVVDLLTRANIPLWCVGVTKGGHPRHPLYVAGKTPLTRLYPRTVD